VDLDEVDGTGTGGRVVAEDVRSDEERQTGRPEATDAAHREARKRGIDLSEVEATGAEGQIMISDVVENAERAAGSAAGGNVAGESAADFAGRTAVTSAQEEAGPDLQSQLPNGRAADPAGGVQEEPEVRIGQAATESGDGEEPRATDAARHKAEGLDVSLSDVSGTGSGGQITITDVTGVAEDDRGAVGQAPRQTTSPEALPAGRPMVRETRRRRQFGRQTSPESRSPRTPPATGRRSWA
jgi:pyruvate/2-oxoglutarate dehydrogenase complex dihydrolipoamide acyltransferase (E2) component